jgi:hypothetical protein
MYIDDGSNNNENKTSSILCGKELEKKKKKGLGFTIPEMKLPWFWGDSGLIELVIS